MIPLLHPNFLLFPSPLLSRNPKTRKQKRGKQGKRAYLQILIRGLLVLLVHGPRGSLRTHAYRDEQREADRDAERRVPGDLPAFAWRGQGAGPVGAEGDIVRCFPLVLARSSLGFSLLVPIPEMRWEGAWEGGIVKGSSKRKEGKEERLRTGLLLLHRQLAPVHLHPVPERHP
jgi:hypothetical protein